MKRIDVTETDGRLHLLSSDSDEDARHEVVLCSAEDVTFPAVWLDDERVYDVEVWQDNALVAAVPPRSDEVDASFAEHERRRSIRG